MTAAGREWLSQEAPECTDWDAFDRAVAAALAELTSAPTTGVGVVAGCLDACACASVCECFSCLNSSCRGFF